MLLMRRPVQMYDAAEAAHESRSVQLKQASLHDYKHGFLQYARAGEVNDKFIHKLGKLSV